MVGTYLASPDSAVQSIRTARLEDLKTGEGVPHIAGISKACYRACRVAVFSGCGTQAVQRQGSARTLHTLAVAVSCYVAYALVGRLGCG